MRRVASLPPLPTGVLLALYLALAFYSRGFPHLANGTLIYVPALSALALLGIHHAQHQRTERWTLLAATGVFALAFTLRSVDRAVCPWFPIGTHFMWHLLNALVVYLTLRALVLTQLNRTREIPHTI